MSVRTCKRGHPAYPGSRLSDGKCRACAAEDARARRDGRTPHPGTCSTCRRPVTLSAAGVTPTHSDNRRDAGGSRPTDRFVSCDGAGRYGEPTQKAAGPS